MVDVSLLMKLTEIGYVMKIVQCHDSECVVVLMRFRKYFVVVHKIVCSPLMET